MPEFNYAKGRVLDSLQFITEMNEFKNDYADKNLNDYTDNRKLQKLIDRTVENILTALIEVCGAVNSENGIAVSSYQEAIKECARFLKFTEDEQYRLAKFASLRNRLAHRYLNFRWQVIKTFRQETTLIAKFIETIFQRENRQQS